MKFFKSYQYFNIIVITIFCENYCQFITLPCGMEYSHENNVERYKAPWKVAIYYYETQVGDYLFICGGTLIHKYAVVTCKLIFFNY
jgi:hypothetical protein